MQRKKLWDSEPAHAQKLAEAARMETCGRVRSRMLAVRHLLTGHGANETAGLFVIGRSQLYYWLHRYRIEGLTGLRDRPRSGAPRHLSSDDETALRLLLEKAPEVSKNGVNFRTQDIRVLLREKFNAHYSMSGVYVLLQRLKLSPSTLQSPLPLPESKPAVTE